ncbi:MAG: shikimate dehydrogenase [Candidatus Hadarchaeales archaeon]
MKHRREIFMLFGDPVEGSLSPPMFNAAFRRLGMNSIYIAVKTPPQFLAAAVAMMRGLGVKGANITIPHKVAIMGYLDKLDKSAKDVEAVNVVANVNGKLVGYNTDGTGALAALEAGGGPVRGKRVVVVGAGGAARAIVHSLVTAGADVCVANRTIEKAKVLAEIVERKTGKSVKVIPLEKKLLKDAIAKADILINATSVGMQPKAGQTIATADMLHPGLIVNDIVYKPLKTRLLKEAEKAGAKTVDGLGMLVNQAALAFKIWTKKEPPVEVMREAAERAMEAGR